MTARTPTGRTDSDSWDLASSVGATATMVAAARAVASAEADPLIDDPFAAPLVRAVGVEFFTKMVDGDITAEPGADDAAAAMTTVMAVRTRFFDDFFTEAGQAGVRQNVILASRLDSRSYRLPWPAGAAVYEIDQPEVIDFKIRTLAGIGAAPATDLRPVPIDLRADWVGALIAAGFDPALPTAWSAEGLLIYLPPDAQDTLFDNISAVSAAGSMLATEFHPDAGAAIGERAAEIRRQWGDQVPDFAGISYTGERNSVVDYLTGLGWAVTTQTRPEVFAGYQRQFPDSQALAPLRNSLSVVARKP